MFTRCFLTSRPSERFAWRTIDNRRLNIDSTPTSEKSLAVRWPVNGRGKAGREHGSVYLHRVRLHVSPVSRGCGIHAAFPFFFPLPSSASFSSSCTVMTNMTRLHCSLLRHPGENRNTHPGPYVNKQAHLDDNVRLSSCSVFVMGKECSRGDGISGLSISCVLLLSGHILVAFSESVMSALCLRISEKLFCFFITPKDRSSAF